MMGIPESLPLGQPLSHTCLGPRKSAPAKGQHLRTALQPELPCTQGWLGCAALKEGAGHGSAPRL